MSILRSKFSQNLFHKISSKKNLRNAVRHIRNKGRRKPGPDGLSIDDLLGSGMPTLIERLHIELNHLDEYRVGPVAEAYIKKDNRAKRRIAILNVFDNVIARACYQVLSEVFDSRFNNSNFGYRPRRNRGQAALHCQQLINSGAVHWFKADIADCYGTMKRKRLKRLVNSLLKGQSPRLQNLLNQFIDQERRSTGIVQGGSLSPFFSNLYLDKVDCELAKKGLLFSHFGDDFAIGCRSKKDARNAKSKLAEILKSIGLSFNAEKSVNIDFRAREKLNFCGFKISADKLGISRQSANRMLQKSKKLIDDYYGSDAKNLENVGYFDPHYERRAKDRDFRKRERTRKKLNDRFESVIIENDGVYPRWLSYVRNWETQHELADNDEVDRLIDQVFEYRSKVAASSA